MNIVSIESGAADRAIRKQCALLVEDSAQDQWLIRRALDASGRQVHLSSARHGDEAVAYLAGVGVYADRCSYPVPALVLLDLKMPRRSGLEVLEWLRREGGELQRVPVVMLSSSEQGGDIRQAYERGANGYVVKPDTHDDLKRVLENICAFWLDDNRPPTPVCIDLQ